MRLIFLLVFIAVCVFAGLAIAQDPGYLFLSYQHWTLEAPLWLGLGLMIASVFILYLLIRLIGALVHAPSATKAWLRDHRLQGVRRRTIRGFIAFAEGSWKQAEKLLVKSSDKDHTAVINYLCAATCAQKQGKISMRDDYLRLAHDSDSRADLAIGITQARLQLESGQLEQGLATLKRLHRLSPSHDFILELLEQVLLQLKDWEGLIDILPSLNNRHTLAHQAYLGLLQQCTTGVDKTMVWHKIPAEQRLSADILVTYLPVLIQGNDMLTAEALVKASLKKTWDIRLVDLYGQIRIPDLDRQIKTAEGWQKPYPEDPAVLLCLGRLYAAKEIWGHAKELLEMSLSIKASPQTYYALGQVYEALGNKEQAGTQYLLGLSLSVRV